MKDEIEGALVTLQIEGKETRKIKARIICIIVAVAILLFLIPYFYPQFSTLVAVDALVILFGGFYMVFDAIPTLFQPLRPTFQAFKEIARTVEIIEKSNKPIAYEEAYRCLKRAKKILEDISLDDLEWYSETNEIVEGFIGNLGSIVLPAIMDHSIKREHLEDIALALYSMNPSRIAEVNKTLQAEEGYKKGGLPKTKAETFSKKLRETTAGSIIYSLALGYGLILGICTVYIVATGQDFTVFIKEKPEIVILGGLALSGLTFWRANPQSELKNA